MTLTETIVQNRTVHVSRTLMLRELTSLLELAPPAASLADYSHAVLEDNALLKRTVSNRQKTLRFLKELYALEASDPVFAALRLFWQVDAPARPLLALLTAVMKDELLRPTSAVILNARPDEVVTKEQFRDAVAGAYPGRLGSKSLDTVARNVASTWTQSGHLRGSTQKVRQRVTCTPGAAAFAFYLGWLLGERGLRLYGTLWAQLLDSTEAELDQFVFAASQRGWLRYKRMGDVVEISFAPLLEALKEQHGES